MTLPVPARELGFGERAADGDLVALPERLSDPRMAFAPQGGAHPHRGTRVLPDARRLTVRAPALPARRRADPQLSDLLAALCPTYLGISPEIAGDRCFDCHDDDSFSLISRRLSGVE